MKVVITSATEMEIAQIKTAINQVLMDGTERIKILFHISGVSLLASCFAITKLIFDEKPDLIIQAGIAGTFNQNDELGKVVVIKDEQLADTGVEEGGTFKDLFDLNLTTANTLPFTERRLVNPEIEKLNLLHLPAVSSVTINEITTRQERIDQIKQKYNPAVESMEGAALHYCCLQTSTSFIQIRALSNYVGERDKSQWKFKASFNNLTSGVTEYLDQLNNSK